MSSCFRSLRDRTAAQDLRSAAYIRGLALRAGISTLDLSAIWGRA
jgi:hypothetical protein